MVRIISHPTRALKRKKGFIKAVIVGGIIVATVFSLTGCGNEEKSSKESKKENTQVENTASNKEKKNGTNNAQDNSQEGKNNNSTSKENTSTNKATTPGKLTVSREGTSEEVPSKEYSSSYGYTIRYATEYFKASSHDDADWFERDEDINYVEVEKENTSYSKKVSTLSNYKKTTVNGYEAVYTTRKAEGQSETTYYVNVGKDYIYEITTSCQDTPEYLEGLGHIMDAMVQTFAVK